MKEIEVITAIILSVVGVIVFEMGQNYVDDSMYWGNLIKLFGLVLVTAGVIIYVRIVDSIDETKKKKKMERRVW